MSNGLISNKFFSSSSIEKDKQLKFKKDALNLALQSSFFIRRAIKDPLIGKHKNSPQSPIIHIKLNILLSEYTTKVSFYFIILSKLVEAINNWFNTFHSKHFENYNFSLTCNIIFDPLTASKFCRLNSYKYLKTKINFNFIYNLKYYQNSFNEFLEKNTDINPKLREHFDFFCKKNCTIFE